MFSRNATKDIFGIAGIVFFVSIVFKGYWLGTVAPPWDFFGDYYTQAFSWWDLGTFFHPTSYLPYLVSGFPAHLGLQISSYYLPVGLVAELSEYTIFNAARLQALTITFGIVGVYIFARRWNISIGSSLIASIGYLFSAGFFSNASHIDIVRAWSFFPWLLIALSPLEKIKWWLIPLTSLLWFQFFVGTYPGNLTSFPYLITLWVIILIKFHKNQIRKMFFWYSITIIPGLLLSSVKWLPFLLTGNGPQIQNQVVVNSGIFSTIIFPYGGTGQSGDLVLPNDLTQRTFYIIPIILILSAFAKKNSITTYLGLVFVLGSILLGIDFPFAPHWQENLPLLDISRFRTIDFKPGISMGLSLLAANGLDNIINRKEMFLHFPKIRKELAQYLIVISIFVSAVIFGLQVGYSQKDLKTTFTWLIITSVLILITHLSVIHGYNFFTFSILIIGVSFLGISWANSFKDPWQVPRIPTENLYFGDNTDKIIANAAPIEVEGRPERVGPVLPIPYPGEMVIQFWNSNELRRNYSTGGYVTIKGEANFQKYVEYALDVEKYKVIEFLQKPSSVIVAVNLQDNVDNCVYNNGCKVLPNDFKFNSYKPGYFEIGLDSLEEKAIIIINEVGWKGWKALSCSDKGLCNPLKVGAQADNLLLNIEAPAGTSLIKIAYETPGINLAWQIFWISTIFIILVTLFIAFGNRKI